MNRSVLVVEKEEEIDGLTSTMNKFTVLVEEKEINDYIAHYLNLRYQLSMGNARPIDILTLPGMTKESIDK